MDLRFKKPRAHLISILERKGIQDQNVLEAINMVERHKLIHSALHPRAYEDTALPIGNNQTISQPYTVARQSELLEVERGDKVLEIGTGSGYQCAILCQMGAKVYTIERHDELSLKARTQLGGMGYRAMHRCGDGTLGWSAFAPYQGIIVTAGAPDVPQSLLDQLAIGGRLVIPVGDNQQQKMLRIIRRGEDAFETEEYDNFTFVPLIGKEGWEN